MDLKRVDIFIEREPYGLVLCSRLFDGYKEWTVRQVFYPDALYSEFDRIFEYAKYRLKDMIEKEVALDDSSKHN